MGFAAPVNAEALEARRLFTTYSVTNTNDSGAGSLRQAIASANATTADDTITFAFPSGGQTISLNSQLLIASGGGALTINGTGSAQLTLRRSGVAEHRIIESATTRLTITGMTIANGLLTAAGAKGGGILIGGVNPYATLDDVVVNSNESINGDGGGIALTFGASLAIRNSTVSGNFAAEDGGGVYFVNGGSLLMENCLIDGNGTEYDRDRDGAGIYFFGTASASPPAGFQANTLLVRNTTIVNNLGADNGAGISLNNFNGLLRVQNCTITGNENDLFNFPGPAPTGGGIGLKNSAGNIAIENSIVAGNFSNGSPQDITVPAGLYANHSAIGTSTGHALYSGSGNNLPYGVDLKLGPLQNNGGPTKTRHPLPGSPLIDAGSNGLTVASLPVDQRGAGFPRIVGASADIGAVEVLPPVVASSAFRYLTGPQAAQFTFTQNVQPSLASSDVVVTNRGTGQVIPSANISVSYSAGTQTATFAFTGYPGGRLPDGNYRATIAPAGVTNAMGFPLAIGHTLDFFVLAGDVNRDRTVGPGDFNLLATNFGKTGRNWSHGDFDYDGTVGPGDFNLLATNFGKTVPAPAGLAEGTNPPAAATARPTVTPPVQSTLPARLAADLLTDDPTKRTARAKA